LRAAAHQAVTISVVFQWHTRSQFYSECRSFRAGEDSTSLQDREPTGIGAIRRGEQDLSHLLDHLRFERLDLRRDLWIENTFAAVTAANVAGVPEVQSRV
jgi:hypothetical protein